MSTNLIQLPKETRVAILAGKGTKFPGQKMYDDLKAEGKIRLFSDKVISESTVYNKRFYKFLSANMQLVEETHGEDIKKNPKIGKELLEQAKDNMKKTVQSEANFTDNEVSTFVWETAKKLYHEFASQVKNGEEMVYKISIANAFANLFKHTNIEMELGEAYKNEKIDRVVHNLKVIGRKAGIY